MAMPMFKINDRVWATKDSGLYDEEGKSSGKVVAGSGGVVQSTFNSRGQYLVKFDFGPTCYVHGNWLSETEVK